MAAFIVLIAGFITTWHQHLNNQNRPSVTIATTEDQPSTDQPSGDTFDQHQVAPDEPRYLSIPAISVNAIVKPVGLTSDNNIGAPDNVFYTGWFIGSAKPGQAGATIIDGHVSSWETAGVFYDLKKLVPGDTMTIERGDGEVLHYRVVKSQTDHIENVDMEAALSPVTNQPGLNLITCSGDIIEGTNEFDQRLVVFTEQI